MSKTVEDIKKGLEACSGKADRCMECPYPIGFDCFSHPMKDAIAYIQQLVSRLAQVELERDAAVEALDEIRQCKFCKHYAKNLWLEPCLSCDLLKKTNYEWRGVCAENTEEDDE